MKRLLFALITASSAMIVPAYAAQMNAGDIGRLASDVTVQHHVDLERDATQTMATVRATHERPNLLQQASLHGSFVTCPNGIGLGDGCPAPNGGSFAIGNFFNGYANQMGQPYAANRPAWNVAGVDFQIGPWTAVSAMTDIATWSGAGCTYTGGNAPVLTCTSSADVEGYNFAAENGHNCVNIEIDPAATGNIVIKNNNLVADTSCLSHVAVSTAAIEMTTGGTSAANFDIENNMIDGQFNQTAVLLLPVIYYAISIDTNAQATVKYNVMQHLEGRAVQITESSLTTALIADNYIQDCQYRVPAGHGECGAVAGTSAQLGTNTVSYNTMLLTNFQCSCYTSQWYASSGTTGTFSGTYTFNNNVMATNTLNLLIAGAGGEPSVDFVIDNGAGAFIGSPAVYQPTGVAGNVLTIMGTHNSNPVAFGMSAQSAYVLGPQARAPDNSLGLNSQWLVDCSAASGACSGVAWASSISINLAEQTSVSLLNFLGYDGNLRAQANIYNGTPPLSITNNVVDPMGIGAQPWNNGLSAGDCPNGTATFRGNTRLDGGVTTNINQFYPTSAGVC